MGTQLKDVTIKPDAVKDLLLEKHADFIHGYSNRKDDYEYIMTEFLRMSGVYWGLTAMDLMRQLNRMDRQVCKLCVCNYSNWCSITSTITQHGKLLPALQFALQTLC